MVRVNVKAMEGNILSWNLNGLRKTTEYLTQNNLCES